MSEVLLAAQSNQLTPVNFPADILATWTPTLTPTATATPVIPSVTPDLFTVQGHVWIDTDVVGQRDAGESGLAGARLEIIIDANHNGAVNPADPVLMSGVSAANGGYSLPGVPRGAYILREVNPVGYRSTTPDEVMIPDEAARLFFIMDFGDHKEQNGMRLYLPLLMR